MRKWVSTPLKPSLRRCRTRILPVLLEKSMPITSQNQVISILAQKLTHPQLELVNLVEQASTETSLLVRQAGQPINPTPESLPTITTHHPHLTKNLLPFPVSNSIENPEENQIIINTNKSPSHINDSIISSPINSMPNSETLKLKNSAVTSPPTHPKTTDRNTKNTQSKTNI